ncbi:MAG: hypothetical protein WC238_04320 [Parcubacteria group bacterium]|jgi:hypothetical protein
MKIAIFEDNYQHMEEAKSVATELGIEVVTFTKSRHIEDLSEIFIYDRKKRTYESKVDGIITDLYMPSQCFPAPDYPYGLVIAAHAFRHNVPFVFCTAGFHHGAKYQMVHEFIMAMDWPQMVDASDSKIGNGEVEHKDWEVAFKEIIKLIKGR